jgi:prepilin-type N-terminal cleavage/methylation domain-containing protein
MQWIRDRLRREDGVTLVELLVTAAVMAIVVAAVMSVWLRGQTESSTIYSRSKDLRQSAVVHTDTASTIDVDTYVDGVKHRIAYTASGSNLTRSVDGVAGQRLLSNLANTNLFTYTFVGSTLHQITILLTVNTSSKEGTLNLQSEVETRNL